MQALLSLERGYIYGFMMIRSEKIQYGGLLYSDYNKNYELIMKKAFFVSSCMAAVVLSINLQ